MKSMRLYTILLVSILFPATLSAQVFDSGPSDPSLFTNLINLPGDALPAADTENAIAVGGVAGETTQVNFAAGSSLTESFLDALAGSEININGGILGSDAIAFAGSEVNVSNGSVGDFFVSADDSQVNITGGTVGDDFLSAVSSVVNISGGSVGDRFVSTDSSVINISGGSVGDQFLSIDSSVINISDGSVGSLFDAGIGSEVNITGGSVGDEMFAFEDSVVNISGGSVSPGFRALDGSTINLFGSDFVVNGVLLDDLVEGEAFTILDRDVTFSGLLADGSAFSLNLSSVPQDFVGGFTPGATLTVTPVVESDFQLGDVNGDGVVSFLDIGPFIAVLSASGDQAEADINGDNVVDFLDIVPFISLLSS